jgi:uncharacterized protein (TIGR02145 family)
MKTTNVFLSLALLFFFGAQLHAQVLIGGTDRPKNGAILDLNSTAKGGLLLSNVTLLNLYTIPADFPGMTPSPADLADAKKKFTGAMVYHKGGYDIPTGIYVWNGTNWTSMEENCKSPALTLSAPFFIKPDVSVSFSVSSDASPRCAAGETYEWFKATSPGGTANTPFGSGTDATASFTSVGIYRVKVTATSPYSAPVEKEVTVSVTADGALDPEMLSNTYGIVGETCLDVKNSDQGKPLAFADRKYAFEGGFTKEYKFVHGNSYTDLNLSYIDDPIVNIVAGITSPPVSANGNSEETFTVTFKPDVRDLVPENGDSLTVKLLASYKNSDNESKLAWLEIRVEDGTCICPAKKDANTWLNYMCHNLGGLDIISSSQLITYKHHGDWYRFGAKNPSLMNTGTNNGTVTNWTTIHHPDYPFYTGSGNWPDTPVDQNDPFGNPCPAGWRLPDHTELSALINKNTSNGNIAEINPVSDVPAPWMAYESDNSVFCNLKKFGDNLYLPAAGWRNPQQYGTLGNRGGGADYWSSTGSGTDRGCSIGFSAFGGTNPLVSGQGPRSSGISVRCVEAE